MDKIIEMVKGLDKADLTGKGVLWAVEIWVLEKLGVNSKIREEISKLLRVFSNEE